MQFKVGDVRGKAQISPDDEITVQSYYTPYQALLNDTSKKIQNGDVQRALQSIVKRDIKTFLQQTSTSRLAKAWKNTKDALDIAKATLLLATHLYENGADDLTVRKARAGRDDEEDESAPQFRMRFKVLTKQFHGVLQHHHTKTQLRAAATGGLLIDLSISKNGVSATDLLAPHSKASKAFYKQAKNNVNKLKTSFNAMNDSIKKTQNALQEEE